MELHTAIRGILRMQGPDFVSNPGFVNALEDFNAFEHNPAFKNVLRIIIADSYCDNLLKIGTWNLKAQGLVNEIVRLYAVDQEVCSYTMQSLAYGLGFTNDTPTFAPANNSPASPKASSPKADSLNKKQKELASMEEEDVAQFIQEGQDYLDSIIEFKGDWKSELGPQFKICSDISVDGDGENWIVFRIEVNGRISLRDYDWIDYFAILYDQRGKIVGRLQTTQFKERSKSYQVLETDRISNKAFKTVSDIKRVVLYWEKG